MSSKRTQTAKAVRRKTGSVIPPTASASYFELRDHPLRSALSNEMHGRKLPPIAAPARLMQIIVMIADADVIEERKALRDLLGRGPHLDETARFFRGTLGTVNLIWERHTEISSYTLIRPGQCGDAFDPRCFDIVPPDWFSRLPGSIVRATQVAIMPDGPPALAATCFAPEDLVHCRLMGGLASLSSDFRLNADGFGRLLIVDRGMTPTETALAVQRVQELGNYRNLALLGLPVAQSLASALTGLEQRLSSTTQNIANRSVADETLLKSLSDLSADVARIVAGTDYRMSASRAYAEIVEDRLRALRVVRVPGHQTLGDFTERRLLPAVRTCVSFSSRLDLLSQRVAWTSGLLRTRVDTELAIQNRDLLVSMDRRNAVQLRLQQTVEGLSVVAISYYAVGLLHHVLEGLALVPEAERETVTALLVPFVLLAVWCGLQRVHGRIGASEGTDSRP